MMTTTVNLQVPELEQAHHKFESELIVRARVERVSLGFHDGIEVTIEHTELWIDGTRCQSLEVPAAALARAERLARDKFLEEVAA